MSSRVVETLAEHFCIVASSYGARRADAGRAHIQMPNASFRSLEHADSSDVEVMLEEDE